MNIAICTDQKDYLNLIERKIKECYYENMPKRIYRFTQRNNLMYSLRFRDYQLLYVEYSMEEDKGMKTAHVISRRLPDCKVVLIVDERTAQSDIVRNGGYDYIIRPIESKSFYKVLKESIDIERSKDKDFEVYLNYKETKVFNTREIRYVESYYHRTNIFTHDEVYSCSSRQKKHIYDYLLPRTFLKVNQGVVVNMNDIDFLTEKNCILKTREVFNTSYIHLREIHKKYDQYRNNKNDGGKQIENSSMR